MSPGGSGPTRRCRFPGGAAALCFSAAFAKSSNRGRCELPPTDRVGSLPDRPAPGRSILARMPSLPRLILSCRRLPASSGCFGPLADLHNPSARAPPKGSCPLRDTVVSINLPSRSRFIASRFRATARSRSRSANSASTPDRSWTSASAAGSSTRRLNRRPTSVNQHRRGQVDRLPRPCFCDGLSSRRASPSVSGK